MLRRIHLKVFFFQKIEMGRREEDLADKLSSFSQVFMDAHDLHDFSEQVTG